MLGKFGLVAGAVVSLGLLAGCTPTVSAPQDGLAVSSTSSPTTPPSSSGGSQVFPTCDEITLAMGGLLDGLAFDADVTATQTNEEAFLQRVCVFTSADGATQLGVTIAAISFQQAELDSYATLPNSLADTRLNGSGAVLQTLYVENGFADHLDSPMYLFDTNYSITIQGLTGDESTALTLPLLTVGAAADAAFAIRALF